MSVAVKKTVDMLIVMSMLAAAVEVAAGATSMVMR